MTESTASPAEFRASRPDLASLAMQRIDLDHRVSQLERQVAAQLVCADDEIRFRRPAGATPERWARIRAAMLTAWAAEVGNTDAEPT